MLNLDFRIRPPIMQGYRRPLVPLEQPLYVHPEAGEAWNLVVEKGVIELGWKHVIDVGEFSVYVAFSYDAGESIRTTSRCRARRFLSFQDICSCMSGSDPQKQALVIKCCGRSLVWKCVGLSRLVLW